jgi:hypothetical protein
VEEGYLDWIDGSYTEIEQESRKNESIDCILSKGKKVTIGNDLGP